MFFRISRRRALGLMAASALPLPSLAAATDADKDFTALGQDWLNALARFSPVSATLLGDHRFDHEIDDLTTNGRAAAAAHTHALLVKLESLAKDHWSAATQTDAKLLTARMKYDLWTEDGLQSWAWDPLVYNELAGDAVYGLMARDFAPLADRLLSATARMEKLPRLLAQARENLILERVPLVHAQTLAKQNKGLTSIVKDLVLSHAGILAAADTSRLEAAAAGWIAAVGEHQTWIDTVLVPGAKGDFRLGMRHYDAKFAFALDTDLTRQQVRERAEAALKTTRATMYDLSRQILKGRPGAPAAPETPTADQQQAAIRAALDIAAADAPARDQVVEVAKSGLAKATAFVRAHDLITLPDAPVKVILMPEFQRGVSTAYCNSPGPLDKGLDTFYAVSPIPDDWTAERTASFLREYNVRGIADIATHEAMPGHYVQLAHSNAYPSVLRAVLSNGPFIEGWAVYAESMMAQEGFWDGDPLYKLVVLKTKLRSISNAILDQAIHVDLMSRAEAMHLMMHTTFQEEGEAAGKWIRASVSSAQLPFYFVGSEEHWDIRREAEKRWGAAFTLKRYHDTVLSFGSPPARYVRQAMFGEAA